jgi:hypothetical protein
MKTIFHNQTNRIGNRWIIIKLRDDGNYDAWKSPYTSPKPHQAGPSLRVKLGGRWVDVSKNKALARAIRQAAKGVEAGGTEA